MAKFCGHCGGQVSDTDTHCGSCGAAVEATPVQVEPEVTIQVPESAQQAPAKKKKKVLPLIITAVIAVIVLIVGVKVFSAFTGYNPVLRKTMNAFEDFDIDTLMDLSSEVTFATIDYLDDDDQEQWFEDVVNGQLDSYENMVGRNLKISYKVNGVYKLETRKIGQFIDNINGWLYEQDAFEKEDFEKIMEVDMTLTIKGSDDKMELDVEDVYMIKEEGEWKVYYANPYFW